MTSMTVVLAALVVVEALTGHDSATTAISETTKRSMSLQVAAHPGKQANSAPPPFPEV
jgi:hypothetical protein